MAEEATLAPGRVLGGRYRLERLIGAGGMATVWRAEDTKLERPVAVKALSETLVADPAYRARFEREARVAAGLLHPNLVKVYDYSADGPRPYLVMEYVEGPTLSALLADDPEAVHPRLLAEGLLRALAHIHQAGVIHRDVKPSNVLVGAGGSPKLTDFGIARPSDATQITQTGHVIGTLRYMAPEVREGAAADERSDLFSLGVLLRESGRGGGDPEIDALGAELSAPDRGDRPSSAEGALAGIAATEALTGAAPAAAATPPTAPTAPRPVAPAGGRERARRRVLAVAATVAALAILLLVALSVGNGGGDGGGRPAKAASGAGQHADRSPQDPKTPVADSAGSGGAAQPASPQAAPPPAAVTEPPAAAPARSCQSLGEAPHGDKKAEKALKEREKACQEAQKAREEAAKQAEEGKGPDGGGPPGQVKGEEGD
jgi:eukaryotic-like serine/threonine-protein kinase